jgi:hypothetical protein
MNLENQQSFIYATAYMDIITVNAMVTETKEMGIERQGTRSTKHDGSTVLLRKILRELKEMKEMINESTTNRRN